MGIALLPVSAEARGASISYLTIAAKGTDFLVRWEIALRDLDDAIGLDADVDGSITQGEVRAHAAAIESYA